MLNQKDYITDNHMDNDFPYDYSGSDSSGIITPKGNTFYTDNIITPKGKIKADSIYSFNNLLDKGINNKKNNVSEDSYNSINDNVSEDSYNSINDSISISNISEGSISGLEETKQHIINIENANNNYNTKIFNRFFIKNLLVRETLFEFVGMYIYIILGNGIYSQVIIYGLDNEVSFINWSYISIGWGLSLIIGMYVALMGNGDGYLNPAILFSVFLLKKISVKKLTYYTIAYFIASFLASLTIYLLNIDNIKQLHYDINTANIFASYKQSNISITTGFFIEVIMMIIFTFTYLCINKNNEKNKKYIELYCKMIGLLFIGISLSLGYSTQTAINPARDFGSRLFTAITPWYEDVFLYSNNWFWVPIVAPYIGSIIGYCLFYILIQSQL